MDTPKGDTSSPVKSGAPSSPSRSVDDPSVQLQEARRSQRLAEARNLSRRYVLLSASVSLLPIPLLDITAVLGLQVKLVHDLARLYAVPFETKLVKPLLKSLLSCGAVSGGSVALIALGMASPGLQTLVGGGFTGGLAGSTLATSEIFIRHFESGGTLEDFAQKNPPATAATIETSPSNSSRKEEPPKTPSTAEETFKDQESAEHAAVLSDSPTSEPQKPVFDEIYGIGNVYRKRLLSHGIYDISALAALDPERLKVILGQRVSLATARDFISQARTLVNVNSS